MWINSQKVEMSNAIWLQWQCPCVKIPYPLIIKLKESMYTHIYIYELSSRNRENKQLFSCFFLLSIYFLWLYMLENVQQSVYIGRWVMNKVSFCYDIQRLKYCSLFTVGIAKSILWSGHYTNCRKYGFLRMINMSIMLRRLSMINLFVDLLNANY